MSLRRGFKAQAERLAVEIRDELGLSPTDRFDPRGLADHLGIPVLGLREFGRMTGTETAARYFLIQDRDGFSAMTVFYGKRRIIIHNERHSRTRQSSDLAHELAHCLLEHPPGLAVSPEGCRYWNDRVEKEANWLGGALLVPREGALQLALSGMPIGLMAEHFGVSDALCSWRVNETGVALQLNRLGRWRQSGR